MLNFLCDSSFSFWQISLYAPLFNPKDYPVYNNFKTFYFLIFLRVYTAFCNQSFYSIWTYAILIMYISNFMTVICSNSCFKFVMSCIAPFNVVNSDCILNVRDFQFVFCLQIHALADDKMNSASPRALFKFPVHWVTTVCVHSCLYNGVNNDVVNDCRGYDYWDWVCTAV